MEQILEGPGQPIQLPDHERVARPQLIEQAVQLGPVPAPTRRLVLEHPFAAGALERTDLGGGVLGVVRLGNPCIAEEHGPVSHFPVANELTLATGLCTRQALAPQPCCINVPDCVETLGLAAVRAAGSALVAGALCQSGLSAQFQAYFAGQPCLVRPLQAAAGPRG